MIAGAVTRNFGVLATDSAVFDVANRAVVFDAPKLFMTARGHVLSFTGSGFYLTNLKPEWFRQKFDELCRTLAEHFRARGPEISDENEGKARTCIMLLAMHKGYPTLAQFSQKLDFEPRYLWTKDEPKIATVIDDDDATGAKAATEFMELKLAAHKNVTPGLMGEVLTRGIYRKADDDVKKTERKTSGGVVSVGVVTPASAYSLSGFQLIGE